MRLRLLVHECKTSTSVHPPERSFGCFGDARGLEFCLFLKFVAKNHIASLTLVLIGCNNNAKSDYMFLETVAYVEGGVLLMDVFPVSGKFHCCCC